MTEEHSKASPLNVLFVFIAIAFLSLRAIDYALIGSFLPACLAVLFLGIAALWFKSKSKLKYRSQKILGLIILLYALAKLLLGGLLKIAPVGSAHATENTSYIYFAISFLALLAGISLLKPTPQHDS